MKNYAKTILVIFFINFVEFRISSFLSEFYIVFPATFLFYSYYVYQSKENIGSLEAFLLGLFVDLISNSGGFVTCFLSLIELTELKGREKYNIPVESIIQY